MTGEVNDLIRALRDGALTLDQVAQRFRSRPWPPARPQPPQTEAQRAARLLEDPEPRVPDSFDDVLAAYDRGELTREQYRVLAEAVAEAKRAQHGS